MVVIFDCDGVLVDSEAIALQVLSEMMSGFGQPMTPAECRDAFMGRHNADILAGMERRLGRALPGEGVRMRNRMLARLERELQPVRGTAAMLEQLKMPICVASSPDRQRIQLTLKWTALERFFEGRLFSGTEVANGKPAPDLFLHVATHMRCEPRACVVVEDSTIGVEAGVAAGMQVVGFVGASHTDEGHAARLMQAGARVVVADMADLPGVLAGLA